MLIIYRIILTFVLLVLLLPSFLAACKSTNSNLSKDTSDKENIKKEVSVPLTSYAGRLRQIDVFIGDKSYPFLFDTGGGLSLISPDVAAEIGCQPYGQLSGQRMSGELVHFGQCGEVNIRVEGVSLNTDIGVFDLMALLPEGLPPLHGVLSLHTFKDIPISIDLHHGVLTIETPESLRRRVKMMKHMKMSIGREIDGRAVSVYLIADAGAGELFFLLDSGNLRGTLLAPHALGQLGLPLQMEGSHQEIELHFPGLGTLFLEAEVANLRHDGVVGAEFMEGFIFTLDISNGRLWAHIQ